MIKRIVLFLMVGLILTGCRGKGKQEFKDERFLFGTYISITVFHEDAREAREAMEAAFAEMARIDKKFNSHWKGSIIDQLNNDPQGGVELDDEGLMLFDEVRRIYELTGGKFDITVEPLIQLWGFGEENPRMPTEVEIEEAIGKIDFNLVEIEGKRISLKEPLEEIDTGAFLKGYATARAKVAIEEAGVESAFITTISSMETLGPKAEGPWRIGIQDPNNSREILDVVRLDGQAMGISGDYQTFVEIEGRRYHHILDPHTGYPVEDRKLVAVICRDALLGDLYSTAFFLMEIEDVLEYVEERENLDVYIVDADDRRIMSSGFSNYIEN